jgi:hypothetical protein
MAMQRALAVIVLLCGLAVLSWPRPASAQVSIWLQKGVSGAGAAGVFAYNEDQLTYGINGGYSFGGVVELDLTIAYLDFRQESLPDDLKGAAVAPRVELHPLKQSSSMPISVGIGGGITGFGFSSDELERMNIEIESYNINGDVAVYRFFKLSSSVGITPALGGGFVHSELTVKQSGREDTTSTDDAFAFQVGTYFAFLDPGGRIWGVAPTVSLGEVTTISLRAGLVWSL